LGNNVKVETFQINSGPSAIESRSLPTIEAAVVTAEESGSVNDNTTTSSLLPDVVS
jgi:hypothetical protein